MLYAADDMITRNFRIVAYLRSLFDGVDDLILSAPFIFRPGLSKSVVMADVSDSNIFYDFYTLN